MRKYIIDTTVLVVLLFIGGLLVDNAMTAERSHPIQIGALTDSWGPTPQIVALRDGLRELGYQENEDFVLGVRFTQGNHALLPTAARDLVWYGVDLLFVTRVQPAGISLNIPGFFLEAASEQGIPTMSNGTFWVERGGLASYGPDSYESGRQAARLVDKILKGTDPAEIPVEVNSKIEFAINLKTAKQLGITIPPIVLYQATKVIQ